MRVIGSPLNKLVVSNLEQADGACLLIIYDIISKSQQGRRTFLCLEEGERDEFRYTACGSLAVGEKSSHETRNDRVAGIVGAISPGPYRQHCQRHGDEPVTPAFTRPDRSSPQTYFTVTGAP